MSKNNRRTKKSKTDTPPVNFFKKGWVILTIIGTLITIFSFPFLIQQWHRFFLTKQEKFEEDHYINGILVPDLVLDSGIIFKYGATNFLGYSSRELNEGKDINGEEFKMDSIPPFDLHILLIGDRFYASAVLRDIYTKEIIGIMNFNRWSLFESNLMDFYSDDNFLEVMDKNGFVVFQLSFQKPNTINLKGYSFVSGKVIVSLSEGYFRDTLSESLLDSIKGIKPIHMKNIY